MLAPQKNPSIILSRINYILIFFLINSSSPVNGERLKSLMPVKNFYKSYSHNLTLNGTPSSFTKRHCYPFFKIIEKRFLHSALILLLFSAIVIKLLQSAVKLI